MKFGHFCLPTYFEDVDGDVGGFMRRFVDFLVSSEDAGFDMLFANEHHFDAYGGLVPSPTVMVAALAQRTKRVKLGSSIIVLPLHSPIEIAEQWAMIDLMSNGRVELGVGRGFVAYDYDRLNVPRDDAQERLKDGVALIRKAWSGETFRHDGPYYKYRDLQVWPRPQQRPHPPIWLSCGGTPDSFKYAGEQGFGIFTVAYRGVEPLIPLNKIYRDAWAAAGRPAKDYKIAAHYQVVLSEDGAEARDIATKALRRYVAATTHQQAPAERGKPAYRGPAGRGGCADLDVKRQQRRRQRLGHEQLERRLQRRLQRRIVERRIVERRIVERRIVERLVERWEHRRRRRRQPGR